MKKIIRLTESDLNRLVKRIIDEASIPPGLINILNNLDNVVRARTVRNLEGLLTNREIDNVISTGTGGTIRISNGDQVLNHFINGRLRSVDAEKVFNSILKAADDDEQIKVMVDFLMNQTSFVSKHKGKTKEQITLDNKQTLYLKKRWAKDNYKNNPNFKLSQLLRIRLIDALKEKTNKTEPTLSLLGCSIEECKYYLESQFKPEMNFKIFQQTYLGKNTNLPQN